MSTVTAFKHLVVASDFGPESDETLRRGLQLAREHSARVTLLHVVEPLPVVTAWGDPGSVAWIGLDALLDAGKAALHRQIARMPDADRGRITGECRVGSPRRDLGTIASELGGDLMLVGSRRERRLGDRLLGSTAQAAVHHALMPLLVCRRPAAATWGQVLAASDFSVAARQAIELAGILAPTATKRLLHVHAPLPEATLALVQPDPGALEAFSAHVEEVAVERFEGLAHAYPRWIGEFRRGTVANTLLAEVRDRGVDLIALGTHGRGPWLGGLLGSVGQAVIAHADADCLLVPASE